MNSNNNYHKNPFLYIHKRLQEVNRQIAEGNPNKSAGLAKERQLLFSIAQYIQTGAWGAAPSAKQRLFILTLRGYQAVLNELGVKRQAMVNCAMRYAQPLLGKIGHSLADLLEAGEVDGAVSVFVSLTSYRGFRLFSEDAQGFMPEPNEAPNIELSDMECELEFLYSISSHRARQGVCRVDEQKLQHLLFICENGGERYAVEQSLVLRYFAAKENDVESLFREAAKLNIF